MRPRGWRRVKVSRARATASKKPARSSSVSRATSSARRARASSPSRSASARALRATDEVADHRPRRLRHRADRVAREEDLADEQRDRAADEGVEGARRRRTRAGLERGDDEDARDRRLVDEDLPGAEQQRSGHREADDQHEHEGVGAQPAHDDVRDHDADGHPDDQLDRADRAPAARHAHRDDGGGRGEERLRMQQVGEEPRRSGGDGRLEDPPQVAAHAADAAAQRAADPGARSAWRGGRALGWIVPARLSPGRLGRDGDAVARRGRDRIVRRLAQVRRQRVEVDRAAEAVGAVTSTR